MYAQNVRFEIPYKVLYFETPILIIFKYLACVAGGIVFARVVLAEKPPFSRLRILCAASSLLPSQNFARANDPAGYAGYQILCLGVLW